jgi:hypothetical protein
MKCDQAQTEPSPIFKQREKELREEESRQTPREKSPQTQAITEVEA